MGLFDRQTSRDDKGNTELRMVAMANLTEEGKVSEVALIADQAILVENPSNHSHLADTMEVNLVDDLLVETADTDSNDSLGSIELFEDDIAEGDELNVEAEVVSQMTPIPEPEAKPEKIDNKSSLEKVTPGISASKLTKIMGKPTKVATDQRLVALNNPALPENSKIIEETGKVAWFVGRVLCEGGDESKPVNGWCLSQYFDSLIRDHYQDGLHHFDGGPAYIKTGPCNTEVWYRKGVPHREDGPAITARHDIGIVAEQFIVNGEVSRKLSTSDTGTIESFFKGTLMNHVNHAPEGTPSVIWRDVDGQVVGQEFRVDGLLHRDNDKPAVMQGPHSEWWVRGERHRIGGAAIITRKGEKSYYLQGKEVSMNAVSKASLDERNNVGIGKAKEEVAVTGNMSEKKQEQRERISSWKSRKKSP